MKRIYLFLPEFLMAALVSAPMAHAQGCVPARSNGETGGPDSEGGHLMPGEFDISTGNRRQFSFEHCVGDSVAEDYTKEALRPRGILCCCTRPARSASLYSDAHRQGLNRREGPIPVQ